MRFINKIEINAYSVYRAFVMLISGLIFPFIILPLYGIEFELMPTNIHFYGAVEARGKIIAYGSTGSYLRSDDFGRSWKQYNLHPFGNIFHMANYKDTLIGVIDKGIIVVSGDGGENWRKREFPLSVGEYFIYVLPTEDCIYIRSNKGIYKFNKELELMTSIKDSLLDYIITGNFYDFDGYNIPDVGFLLGLASLSEIYIFKDKLIILDSNLPPALSGLIVADKDLKQLEIVPTAEHIYLDTSLMNSRKRSGGLRYLFPFDSVLIINKDGCLFITKDIYSKWEFFFPDTAFLNPNDIEYWKKWPPSEYSWNYFFWENELYMEILTGSKGKWIIPAYDLMSGDAIRGPILYYYKKYYLDEERKTFKFEKYRNHFNDRSIAPVVNPLGFRINVTYFLYIYKKAIIGDSIVVVPGIYKTLIQTRDGCNSWDLVSCNAAWYPRFILNDTTFVYFNKKPRYHSTAVTFDGGVTFRPTELFKDTMLVRLRDYENYDTVTFFTTVENTLAYTIDSTGRGFWIGTPSRNYGRLEYPNFAFTKDYGIRFDFDTLFFFRRYPLVRGIPLEIERYGDAFIFPLRVGQRVDYSEIYYLDTSFMRFARVKSEDYLMINQIHPVDDKHLFLFAYRADSSDYSRQNLEILESFDSGKTVVTLYRFDETEDLEQYYVYNRDSIFFRVSNPSRIYLFDVKRKALEKIYESTEDNNPQLMVISNRFYIVGWGLFLENTDRSDLTQWREGEWDYGKPYFESVIFKGNVAIAGLSDSLRPFNYYKITLKSGGTTGVEEPVVEKRYYSTKFWASEAYPVPGSVKVKARIEWDRGIDIVKAIDGVYDSMGRKVEGRERIEIREESGGGRGEVEWVCEGLPGGVYFIVFRWEGGSEAIPVVVE